MRSVAVARGSDEQTATSESLIQVSRPGFVCAKDKTGGGVALSPLSIALTLRGPVPCCRRRSRRCEEEEQRPSLEEELHLSHLEQLEKLFAVSPGRLPEAEGPVARRESQGAKPRPEQMPRPERSLTVQELRWVLCELLGSDRWKTQVELLLKKISPARAGYVTWNELCSHLLLQFKERDEADRPLRGPPLHQPPVVRHCPQNKQEPTTRVLAIPCPPPLQFVSVSRGGVLSVWDDRFRLQKTYKISADVHDLTTERSQMKSWTTDAAYLPNVHRVAVATTSRKIHFLEMSPTSFFEEFHLFGLNDVPTCLCYWHKSEDGRSLLLWGDDHGGVNVLWFLRPLSGLIDKSLLERSGLSGIFMQDISEHGRFLRYYYLSGVHPEAISQIQHLPEDQCITSSRSSEASVVIVDLWKKRTAYTWKIKKGVRCFDYCKPQSLLATGGSDCTVRLWNRYVPGWPTAVLRGHSGTVLGVAILQSRDQLLSFSQDGVLKVWALGSSACLQTVRLPPDRARAGRGHEPARFPLLLLRDTQPRPPLLVVAYADCLGLLRGAAARRLRRDPPGTRQTPLSGVLDNPTSHQVVTGCCGSTLAAWDAEAGTRQLPAKHAPREEALACLALEGSDHSLVTATGNSTVKGCSQKPHATHSNRMVSTEYVPSGSSDRTTELATSGRLPLGTFGQWPKWNLPATITSHEDSREKTGQFGKKGRSREQHCLPLNLPLRHEDIIRIPDGMGRKKTSEERTPTGTSEQRKESKDGELSLHLGALLQELTSPSKGLLDTETLSPDSASLLKSSSSHCNLSEHLQGPFQHSLDARLKKRISGRRERRCLFGDIDVHKLLQFGQICSPFHALTTPEMEGPAFPRDLPVSSRMLNRGLTSLAESDLRDLHLSFPEREEEEEPGAKHGGGDANENPFISPVSRQSKIEPPAMIQVQGSALRGPGGGKGQRERISPDITAHNRKA
ncbi:WD repeat-containing protein on Y chromosome-like [Tachyglossus aculeatus]|uniref:WD repeat-containing protein on Y chromosome-like n=1 Tax=Tachyglossus aculeatus TaxID=9261 RepID=UPI0018F61A43|nr:WD repeat-containing protein on Y chromosome-like [Tachyglossus aculeatus]